MADKKVLLQAYSRLGWQLAPGDDGCDARMVELGAQLRIADALEALARAVNPAWTPADQVPRPPAPPRPPARLGWYHLAEGPEHKALRTRTLRHFRPAINREDNSWLAEQAVRTAVVKVTAQALIAAGVSRYQDLTPATLAAGKAALDAVDPATFDWAGVRLGPKSMPRFRAVLARHAALSAPAAPQPEEPRVPLPEAGDLRPDGLGDGPPGGPAPPP